MASSTAKKTTDQPETAGNDVPHQGDHDRVQMLSLRADGTPDQHNPEIIGNKDVAIKAAKEQFAQQAVSAADLSPTAGGTTVEDAPQDPTIQAAVEEHQKAADAAEKAAEATVESLTRD